MCKVFGLMAVTAAVLLAGCNTIEGIGKDVSSAGKTVSKTAHDAK
ncbi:entericidin A/B family lipoprotein [uncultured Sphingomonas sp.]|nr:entericidin A/B family lipoprotein [uncultured Sphingomonas sp.]